MSNLISDFLAESAARSEARRKSRTRWDNVKEYLIGSAILAALFMIIALACYGGYCLLRYGLS